MSSIILPSRWTSQPQGIVEPRPDFIGRAGFLFDHKRSEGSIQNLAADGYVLGAVANSLQVNSAGIGAKCSSNTRSYYAAGWNPFTTSDGAGTGDFTVIILSSPQSGTTNTGPIVHLRNDVGTSYFESFLARTNRYHTNGDTSGASTLSAGDIWLGTFSSQPGHGAWGIRDAGALNGQPHCWVFKREGTTVALWRDGRFIGRATGAAQTDLTSTANPKFSINGWASADGFIADGITQVTAELNYAVPDGYAQSLSANPWGEIFKKRPHILYFDVGGGGGATDYPTAADSSSFALTGSAANGVSAKVGVADASSYAITGSDANGAKSIVAAAESSTYTITGSDANAIRALVSAANSSSYVITGSDAQGVVPTAGDTPSAAGSSSYAITGSDSLGTQAFVSAANSGSYVITGVDANASKSIQAVAESGSYTITGSDTSITRSFASAASSGSYVIEVGTANGVYSGEPTVTLGAGSRKKKKETKQYLVDGVLRELTDEQAAQIMYEAVNTAQQQPKKIVLEDKPEPLEVPEELKKKSIFRPENLEKLKAKAKTPKPVFAKEVIQVKPEHVVVKQVDDDDESLVLQWLERDAEDRRLLAKQLQQLYVTLSGRR
jgi:hypothetical protein